MSDFCQPPNHLAAYGRCCLWHGRKEEGCPTQSTISRHVVKHEASQEGGCNSSMNVKLLADIPCFIGNRVRLTGPLAGDGSHGELSSRHDKPLHQNRVVLLTVLVSSSSSLLSHHFWASLIIPRQQTNGQDKPVGRHNSRVEGRRSGYGLAGEAQSSVSSAESTQRESSSHYVYYTAIMIVINN